MQSTIKLTLFMVLLFITTKTWAQQSFSKKNEDFTNEYKWDLSLDMYNLLKTGDALVMLRYEANKSGAFRFKLGGVVTSTTISTFITPTGPIVDLYTQKSLNVGVAAGYEFHKNTNRFQLFYGPELSFSTQTTSYSFTPNYQGPKLGGVRIPVFQLNGFIGVKYFIFSRLSISSETYLIYRFQNSKGMDLDKPNVVAGQSKTRSLQLYGLKFLNVSLHF